MTKVKLVSEKTTMTQDYVFKKPRSLKSLIKRSCATETDSSLEVDNVPDSERLLTVEVRT